MDVLMTDDQSQLNEMHMELNAVYAERNHCIAVIVHMAATMHYNLGYANLENGHYMVIVDMPYGQQQWTISSEDWNTIPLFRELPPFQGKIKTGNLLAIPPSLV